MICCESDAKELVRKKKKYCTIVEREERYMEEIDREIARLCITMEKKRCRRRIIQLNKRMEKLEKEKRKRFKRVIHCKNKINHVEDIIGAEEYRSGEAAGAEHGPGAGERIIAMSYLCSCILLPCTFFYYCYCCIEHMLN